MDTGQISVDGHCYCGEVKYRVVLEEADAPIFSAYCHCDSCRRSHAAPLYHVVCVDDRCFQLTEGADLVVPYQKPGSRIVRAFCDQCGTRLFNRFPGWSPGGRTPVVFFPNTLDEATAQSLPAVFRPVRNNRPEECVLDQEFLREHLE